MEMKYIWLIIAAVFVVGELLTAGFFLIWFGIAAAVAALLAFLNVGAPYQWGVFIVLSFILFLGSRRFAERVTKKQPPGVGADRFIDEVGIVLEEIDNLRDKGMIRVGREEWRAVTKDNEIIPVNAKIKVMGVQGTSVVVKRTE